MADVVLLRYSLVLQPDGNVTTKVVNIDPDTFLKMANEFNDKWENAPIITESLKYLLKQLEVLDNDLDRFIKTL